MYEQAMGNDYGRLADTIQRFHRLAGHQVMHGAAQTDAPASIPAKLLALCLGSPLTADTGPIRFELEALPREEIWTRHFPFKTMTSRLTPKGRQVIEHLGLARLAFDLREEGGSLEMCLQALHFVGVPCPRWLMPRVFAKESEIDGQLHFSIRAEVPGIGVVAGYRGWLAVPQRSEQ